MNVDLIELPQWDVGENWIWFYIIDVEGEITTMIVTEEIIADDVQQTDNGTVLGEPCYKLEAKTHFMGATISTSTAYLSVETLELIEEDFQGDGMPLFLYGFMAEIDWPLVITDGGPYQWSDAGEISTDAGTYACYKFEGASGPLYYSPDKNHIVKAEMGEITFELKKGGSTQGEEPEDNDDDDIFSNTIGPIPLIGLLGLLVVVIIVGLVIISRKGGKKESNVTPPPTDTPPIQQTAQDVPPTTYQPPTQYPTPQVTPTYQQQMPPQQQGYYQPQPPVQQTPPTPQPTSPGQWQCLQCSNMSDLQFAFCMNCGYKRQS